jgi:glycosyltransferase involved in cell wall biosynthesis
MQKRRKVIHLLYSGLGGHGSVFFSLIKADKKKDIETEAIFCGIEDVREDYINQCVEYNVRYSVVKKKAGLDIGSYFRVYSAFKKGKPDTLLLHGSSFIIPARVFKFFKPKTRLIVRETQAHHLKTKRDWFWIRLAVKFSDYLIFLTKESLDDIRNKVNQKRIFGKAVIIPNGIDTEAYKPVAARDISKSVVIGMQSRLQKIKDHKTLLKALSIVKHNYPGRQLYLKIAGDGETMNELVVLAGELGLSADVKFCGMLNEKALLEFMHSLDIYVHATLGETMSNSIMQAMACGLPIIASDVWGVNNMINDKLDGLLFKSENADDLSRILEEVIQHTELRRKISVNARTAALEKYSHYRLFKDYKELYGFNDQL